MSVQVLTQELTGYEYDSGLRDQNAIVYLLKRDWAQHAQHVQLVNAQYCLNCYWRNLLQQGDLASSDKAVRVARHTPCTATGRPLAHMGASCAVRDATARSGEVCSSQG